MNKVELIGRLTRDPNVTYTQGEKPMAIARFTLAVDRRGRRSEENNADFISCVAFDKTAEFAEKYLHQGTKVAVVGRIQTGSYTNRDGQTVYTTDVVVEDMEFVEKRASTDGNGDGEAAPAPEPAPAPAAPAAPAQQRSANPQASNARKPSRTEQAVAIAPTDMDLDTGFMIPEAYDTPWN